MPHDYVIRSANIGDLNELARLFDAYRQFYQQAPDARAAREFIAARMEKDESILLFACDDSGKGLGFCQLYPTFCSVLARPILVLYDLYVDVSARRQGVARALLAAAREEGLKQGVARLDLTTARTNHAAQALYESMGWVRDEVFLTYNLDLAA